MSLVKGGKLERKDEQFCHILKFVIQNYQHLYILESEIIIFSTSDLLAADKLVVTLLIVVGKKCYSSLLVGRFNKL